MRTNIFDKLSFLSLFLVIILLPVFFLPFTNIPVEISKGLLLVLGLALCIIFWALARFSDGKISVPKSWLLVSGGAIVLVFFLSALFSSASEVSFFGAMLDVESFWFIFAGFLLMLCASVVFRNLPNTRIVLFGLILSSALVLIFQSLRFLMPTFLSLGVLGGKTDNILGSWNAFGLFAGFSALMSLLVIEFFSITRALKWILEGLIVLSIILIAAVNLPFVWELLGVSSLIIFVYKVSINSSNPEGETKEKHFPAFSFTIVMITLLFFMSGQFIGGILPNRLGLSNSEVSPSLRATALVTKSVLKNDPIFGLGPNRFGEAWAMYKPASINATVFWDVSFAAGSGLVPTLVSTTGYLGILTWLVFFGLFIFTGVKSIFSGMKKGVGWEIMAFFVLSLYLFVSAFFYSTGPVMFLLALAFTGVFIGLSAANIDNEEISILFLNDHRKSFFSILLLVLVIVISAAASFKYAQRLASVSYYGRAFSASTVPAAETSINKALSLYQNDLYLRTYAQIYLVKLNSLAAKGSSLSDTDKADLQTSLDQVASGAQLATVYNPANYLNFFMLGSVYQTFTSLGVKDTSGKAIEAYKKASALNPLNPRIKLAMASTFLADGKVKEAKSYANEALSLKGDYIDALITLSQIAKSEGDTENALAYAQTAFSISPTNKDLLKYVDSLKNPSSTSSTDKKDISTKVKKQ